MSENPLDEMRERREAHRGRLDEAIADLVAVIAADAPAFLKRAARQAFVAQPLERAEALGPDEVRRIKGALADAGQRLASEAATALREPALWHRDDLPAEPSDPKSLESNPALQRAVQEQLAGRANALLTELGLEPAPGASDFGLSYRIPTWFVDGKYPPALVEKYWLLRGHLRELDAQIEAETEKQRREALAARWDEA